MSSQPKDGGERKPENEAPLDGGYVAELREPEFQEIKHQAETAKSLAFVLVGVMAGSLLLHYVAILICTANGWKDSLATLEDAFGKWLPMISGLVAAAVTYYFARGRN